MVYISSEPLLELSMPSTKTSLIVNTTKSEIDKLSITLVTLD